MSRSIGIFLKNGEGNANLIQWIGSVIGYHFQPSSSRGDEFFEDSSPSAYLTLGSHDFENDRDLDFESYPYYLEVQSTGITDGTIRDQQTLTLANEIFDKLQVTERLDLMLVDNLQTKLREYRRPGRG